MSPQMLRVEAVDEYGSGVCLIKHIVYTICNLLSNMADFLLQSKKQFEVLFSFCHLGNISLPELFFVSIQYPFHGGWSHTDKKTVMILQKFDYYYSYCNAVKIAHNKFHQHNTNKYSKFQIEAVFSSISLFCQIIFNKNNACLREIIHSCFPLLVFILSRWCCFHFLHITSDKTF